MLYEYSDFVFVRIFVKLADNKDSHKISDKFNLGLDRTIHFGVTCPWAMKNFPIDLQWRKCQEDSAFTYDQIIFELAGNQDSHKILDEFEFRPHQTLHFGVTCPLVLKKPLFNLAVA